MFLIAVSKSTLVSQKVLDWFLMLAHDRYLNQMHQLTILKAKKWNWYWIISSYTTGLDLQNLFDFNKFCDAWFGSRWMILKHLGLGSVLADPVCILPHGQSKFLFGFWTSVVFITWVESLFCVVIVSNVGFVDSSLSPLPTAINIHSTYHLHQQPHTTTTVSITTPYIRLFYYPNLCFNLIIRLGLILHELHVWKWEKQWAGGWMVDRWRSFTQVRKKIEKYIQSCSILNECNDCCPIFLSCSTSNPDFPHFCICIYFCGVFWRRKQGLTKRMVLVKRFMH